MSDAPQPKPRWYRFSRRSLLLSLAACSLVCIWFGVTMQRASQQKRAVESIKKLGGSVLYGYEMDASGSPIPGAEPLTPAWLRRLFGDDFFANVSWRFLRAQQ